MPFVPPRVLQLYRRIAAGGFVRNVATLVGGAAVAQFLPVLFTPLLTRLYSPTDFGVLTHFVAWLSNLVVIATWRYDMAIVLPKEDDDAIRLLMLALGFNTLLLAVLSVPLWLENGWLSGHLAAPELAPWLPLLPLGVWLAANNQIWTNWNNRQRRYSLNAQGRVGQSLAMSLVQLGGGFAKLGTLGLIVGQLAGQGSSWLLQSRPDLRLLPAWLQRARDGGVRRLMVLYREFPLVNTPHAFVVALQDSLMVQLLTVIASAEVMGHYGLVLRVLKLPAALLGQAVSQVLYRDLAEAHSQRQPLRPLLAKAQLVLGAVSLLPFAVLMVWGEPLFALAFGEAWRDAGVIAGLLVPSFFFMFIATPCFMVPMVLSRQRTSFLFALLGIAANLGTLGVVYWLDHDAHMVFRLQAWVMSVYYVIYMMWIYRLCRQQEASHA
jgi:O-antigen/teichoic acid export membrane protein